MKILHLDQQSYQKINEISNYISQNIEEILFYDVSFANYLDPMIIQLFISKNHRNIEKYEFKINGKFRSLNTLEFYKLHLKIKIESNKISNMDGNFFLYYHLLFNQFVYKFKKQDKLRIKPFLIRRKFKLTKDLKNYET